MRFGNYLRRLLSILLVLSMAGVFFVTPVTAAGETFSLADLKYPESLQYGKSFSLRGTVSSETNITSITIGVFDGDRAITSHTATPNAKSYSIKSSDVYIVFGAVPVGVYQYRITASNATETNCVIHESELTIFATVSIDGAVYPSSLVEGASFSVKGTVTSQNTLSSVTVGVYKPDGTMCTGGTATTSGTTYNLKNLDSKVVFGDLPVGSYFYRITASDSETKNIVLADVQFSVTDSFRLDEFTPPELISAGASFLLDGTLKSTYTLKTVTTGIYLQDGTAVQSNKVSLSSTSYDLSALNAALDFAILPDGQYVFRMVATNSHASDRTVVEVPFTVLPSGAETMTLSGANFPTYLIKGASYSLNGIISSTSNITSVTVAVLNAAGNKVIGKTVSPNASVYSIRNVDKYITFGDLAVGSYVYRITATNATSANKVLLNVTFKVVTAVSQSYRDWKMTDERWSNVTFSGGHTLGNKGDAITALAMLAVQAGVKKVEDGFTPETMCTALAVNNAIEGAGNIKWSKVPSVLRGFSLVDSSITLTGNADAQLKALDKYLNATDKQYAVLLYAGGTQWVACRSLSSNKLTIMDPAHTYTNWLASYPLMESTPIVVFEISYQESEDLPITGNGSYVKWTQGDARWANMKLGGSKLTMASSGCVVTSLAMLAVHYGLQDESVFNPGIFLEALNEAGALTNGGALYWNKVDNVLTGFDYAGKMDLTGSAADKAALFGNLLSQGYAVVINVNRTHWVGLRSVIGDKVYMFDSSASSPTVLFDEYPAAGVTQCVVYKVSASDSLPLPLKAVLKAESILVRAGKPFVLSWDSITGASCYRLRIYNSKGEDVLGNADAPYLSLTETVYMTENLPADRYTAVVQTVCMNGSNTLTSQSDPLAFTIFSAPIEPITVTSITHHSADICWTAVAGAVSYNIYVNGKLIGNRSAATASCSLYGLVSFSEYSVEIRALDETGEFSRGDHSFTTLSGEGCNGLRVGDSVLVDGIVNTASDGTGENVAISKFEAVLRYVDGSSLNPFGFFYPDENGTFYYANAVVVSGEGSANILLSSIGVLPDGYEIPDDNVGDSNIILSPEIVYLQGDHTLILNLSVEHCTTVGKCAVSLRYDHSLLTLNEVVTSKNSVLSDSMLLITHNPDSTDTVTIGNAKLNDVSGALITLYFTVLPEQTGEAVITTAFSSIGAFATGAVYPSETSRQTITKVARDIDGDSMIGDADVRVMMDAILGKSALSNEAFSLADMDGDGKLTNKDAVLFKRYLASKEA